MKTGNPQAKWTPQTTSMFLIAYKTASSCVHDRDSSNENFCLLDIYLHFYWQYLGTKITVPHHHFCYPFLQKLEKYTLNFNNPSKANDSSSLFYLSSPNIYSISKIFNIIVMKNFVLKIFHSSTHWIQ